MDKQMSAGEILAVLQRCPQAAARMQGSREYPGISGCVRFYQTKSGVLVAADIAGLPRASGGREDSFFGFHIHDGTSCSGTEADPFADALTHYNPKETAHPEHAGDLPPLLGAGGRAVQIVLTDRFCVRELLHKTVIIHAAPDDFTSQPAGCAGKKIACGWIESRNRD